MTTLSYRISKKFPIEELKTKNYMTQYASIHDYFKRPYRTIKMDISSKIQGNNQYTNIRSLVIIFLAAKSSSICRHVGLLVCWSVQHEFQCAQQVSKLFLYMQSSTTVLQCYSVTVLQCYSVTVLQCYSVTVLQCYSVK